MHAQILFDTAPLGARIAFSDGTPKPPARFTKKLSAWENRNGTGRLTSKISATMIGSHHHAAGFALHLATYSSHGTPILVVTRHYSVNSSLEFEIIDRPTPGMVRILKNFSATSELLHLAANTDAAEVWLQHHHYTDAVLEVVTDTELSSDLVLGRAA